MNEELLRKAKAEADALRQRAEALDLEALQSIVQGLFRDSQRAQLKLTEAEDNFNYHEQILTAGLHLWSERAKP